MLKKFTYAAAFGAAIAAGAPALGGISVVAVDGTNPYSGPAPTYDFDTTIPVFVGGQIQTTSNSTGANPFPGFSAFYTVGPGPNNSSPGTINLTGFGGLTSLSFIWGSVDTYNDLDFLGFDGTTVLGTYNGTAVAAPANGNQTSASTNRLVTFSFTGTDQAVGYLRLRSTSQAFEIANLSVAAVPEPTTWALFILGFGAIGATMRRRSSQMRVAKASLNFA